MADKKIRLGNLENAYRITSDDGRTVTTVTTPSMWALADDFADELRIAGNHSELWVLRKMTFAIQMQAAQAEGLYPACPLNLPMIYDFLNRCKVEDVEAERIHPETEEEAGDPTQGDQAGGPAVP